MRAEAEERQAKQKAMQKLRCWGCCLVIAGVILIVTACFTPKVMDKVITSQAQKSAQLTEANEPEWDGIPGKYDIEIAWNHYLYNCTNFEDVVFKDAAPEFMEFGPYIYREYDTYDNLTWGSVHNWKKGDDEKAVNASFNQFTKFQSDEVGNIDDKMYFTNQAAFGVWYQLNYAPKWRTYITLLYSIVLDGLGRQVADTGVFEAMSTSEFKTWQNMNAVLLPNAPLSDAKAQVLYNDPYYGLGDPDNYYHWNSFLSTTAPQEKIAWRWEVKTYFDLTQAQVDEIETNWNTFYSDKYDLVVDSVPSPAAYLSETGVAYWQWAEGYMTSRRSQPYEPSVSKVVNTVTGYPEISYFISDYLLKSEVSGVSSANIAAMQGVKLYDTITGPNPNEPPTTNYEYLFTLQNASGGDPDGHSLFNVQTLKKLCMLGEKVTNIIKEPAKTYNVDFNLENDPDWTTLANNLGLTVRQTYVIWLWMDTAWDQTFARIQDGGDTQMGILGTLGAAAFNTTINQMQLEFPMFTLAETLALDITNTYGATIDEANCEKIYTEQFKMDSDQAVALCTKSTMFNFTDIFESSVAMTNTYLYGSVYNPQYYNDFMAAIGLKPTDPTDMATFRNMMWGTGSGIEAKFDAELGTVYQNYKSLCDNQISSTHCAFSNLTYNQWLSSAVLQTPMPGQTVSSTSYVKQYTPYSQLIVSPELSEYAATTSQTVPTSDIADVYQSFNVSGLFNGKIFQDVWLGIKDKGPPPAEEEWSNVWTVESFQNYIRFITMNYGVTGMFTYKSPREMIEGYEDPLISKLHDTPVYMGGDQTASPILSLDNPPTHVPDNPVSFFTGEDDYQNTRRYGTYLGGETIQVAGKDYESLTKLFNYTFSPWEQDVYIDGTDGMQFQPTLTDDLVLGAFVNDLSRNCYFDFSHNDDRYEHYTIKVYNIKADMMYNMTKNPANENFQVYVDGTTNMTSTLNAPAFCAKGHYYEMSEVVESSKCKIVDSDGKAIEPNAEADDTYLGMEEYSGACALANERIFYNMQVFNDRLWQVADNTNGYGKFIPLAFVAREAVWTHDQVDAMLGALVTGMRVKWSFFGIMLGLGLIFLGLAIFCGFRYYQHKKHLEQSQEEQLVDPMLMATSEDELREFSGDAPTVTANERTWNQGGRPFVGTTDNGHGGMLDGPVNKTNTATHATSPTHESGSEGR